MSTTPLKYLEALPAPFTPVNTTVVAGDTLPQAIAKLQGQVASAGGGSAQCPRVIASNTMFTVEADCQVPWRRQVYIKQRGRLRIRAGGSFIQAH